MLEIIRIYVSKTSFVSSSSTYLFPVEDYYIFLATEH